MSSIAEKLEDHVLKTEPAGSSNTSTDVVEDGEVDIHADWTDAEEKAIRRKFDLTIVPMVTVLC